METVIRLTFKFVPELAVITELVATRGAAVGGPVLAAIWTGAEDKEVGLLKIFPELLEEPADPTTTPGTVLTTCFSTP